MPKTSPVNRNPKQKKKNTNKRITPTQKIRNRKRQLRSRRSMGPEQSQPTPHPNTIKKNTKQNK